MKKLLKCLFVLVIFNSCSSQEKSFPIPITEVSDKEINTKNIDSIFFNAKNQIVLLDNEQKDRYLMKDYKGEINHLKSYFVAYKENAPFYSLFLKVIIGDAQSEIVLVNVDENLNYLDSKIVHGGLFTQPEELDNGDVRWADRNFSIVNENKVIYNQVKVYTEGFEEDAEERLDITSTEYKIDDKGSISKVN